MATELSAHAAVDGPFVDPPFCGVSCRAMYIEAFQPCLSDIIGAFFDADWDLEFALKADWYSEISLCDQQKRAYLTV